MRPFLFISTLVALASARPEPSIGYNYPSPTPSQQYGSPLLGGSLDGINGIGGLRHIGLGSASTLGYSGGVSSGIGIGSASLGSNQFSSGSNQFSLGSNQLSLGSNQYTSGFLSGSTSGFDNGLGIGRVTGLEEGSAGFGSAGTTQVHKHIYVHVAPEDPEDIRLQQQIPVAPAQKHYKIIFIKAPSAPTPTAPVVPVQPQNEEKTLVYVLVKKPDDPQDLVIPTPAPTQPSKPEVYFIKYNTKKETVAGATIGGQAVNDAGAGLVSGINGAGLVSGINGAGIGSGIDSAGLGAGIDLSGSAGVVSGQTGFAGIGGISGGASYIENSHGSISSALVGGVSGLPSSAIKYGPPGYHHK